MYLSGQEDEYIFLEMAIYECQTDIALTNYEPFQKATIYAVENIWFFHFEFCQKKLLFL